MNASVLCLRPEADFLQAGVTPPDTLSISYRAPGDPDVPAMLGEALALVIPAVGPKLDPALFEASAVRLVQVTGAGVDRLDEAAMKKLGIPVCNVVGGSNAAVAEYVLTAALMLLRRFSWADNEIRAGHYKTFRQRMVDDSLRGLRGLAVGVVGFGNIGQAAAKACRQMGAEILYYDPAPSNAAAAAAAELDAKPMPLDRLLTGSDVVTLHLPLLPATRGLIGAAELARMKHDAILVNAARGGIVDEAALAEALTAGRLGGVAVDVYENEPPTDSNPLFSLEGEAARRVLFTPHIAGVTRQSWATLFSEAWNNVERVISNGELPRYRVY